MDKKSKEKEFDKLANKYYHCDFEDCCWLQKERIEKVFEARQKQNEK